MGIMQHPRIGALREPVCMLACTLLAGAGAGVVQAAMAEAWLRDLHVALDGGTAAEWLSSTVLIPAQAVLRDAGHDVTVPELHAAATDDSDGTGGAATRAEPTTPAADPLAWQRSFVIHQGTEAPRSGALARTLRAFGDAELRELGEGYCTRRRCCVAAWMPDNAVTTQMWSRLHPLSRWLRHSAR